MPHTQSPEEYRDRARLFQSPGSNSALRRVTRKNPRQFPCPNCGTPDALTREDVKRGYQCNTCANSEEGAL